jgi:hypothetical protein
LKTTPLILALLVAPIIVAPLAAAQPDPIDCASLLVDPTLRPTVWENATLARAWGTDRTVAELNATNTTLAEAFADSPRADPVPLFNATRDTVAHGPGVATPSQLLALLVERAAPWAVGHVPAALACADASLGVSDTTGPVTREVGNVTGTIANKLAPLPQAIVAFEHGVECGVYDTLGQPTCQGASP